MSNPTKTPEASKKPAHPRANKKLVAGVKLRGADKLERIPIKVIPSENLVRKPSWIKVRIPAATQKVQTIKSLLRQQNLHSVCEEASCPNLPECFSKGTATFMIMGDICTRRCPFCDVAHGKPKPLDADEPKHLAESIATLKLKYVVITSVDRDDLKDSGAQHFADCINQVRRTSPDTKIEVLVPDFRGRMDIALEILSNSLPDVMNHNLETVPSLYKAVRPGADYQWSLDLLNRFKSAAPDTLTKSGLMLGLGESITEVEVVMEDLVAHQVDMLTLGQYLQPSKDHFPVKEFIHPEEFNRLAELGKKMGFKHVASGPMVRSSYHADQNVIELIGK